MNKYSSRRVLKKAIIGFILSLFVLNMCFLRVNAQSIEPSSIVYNWSENTFRFSYSTDWDGTPVVLNYTGSYIDQYTRHNNYFNESGDTWIKEIVTTNHYANYSHFTNTTLKGSISIDLELNVYMVDIRIGDAGRVIWMAVKSGTLYYDEYYEGDSYAIKYFEEYKQELDIEYFKYNTTTWNLMDTWNATDTMLGEVNYSHSQPYQEALTRNQKTTYFSTPLFVVMQMYTTETRDKIAWANVFHDFIFYEDEDNDGIYSIGDTDNPSSEPSMVMSDEFRGFLMPLAEDTYFESSSPSLSYSWRNIVPYDKTVDEIAATIQFTPPSTTTGNDISWSIQYPDFPCDTTTVDHDKPTEEWWWVGTNATYAETSPATYTYSFDYNIDETQADLDFTLGMPKISNDSFYEAVQGYGLCLPHYNYFLSTFDIAEQDSREMTVPANMFSFISNNTVVAEMNMMKKDEYTIYDYPRATENTVLEAEGASVNPLVMGAAELDGNSGNRFANLIYGITEFVSADPHFDIQADLYRLETQNYPVWSGEKFTHDPTLTIHYTNYTTYTAPSTDGNPPQIPGYSITIIATIVVTITYIEIKRKRKIPN